MFAARNIGGYGGPIHLFICDFRFSIFESKSELSDLSGINRRTDGTTANRARRTALQPLHTSKTILLSVLLCVKLPSFTSENKKTAQPNIRFNGDWNFLRRPGRNDLLVSNPELNCPIAITNIIVLSTIGPDLSRRKVVKRTIKFFLIHLNGPKY